MIRATLIATLFVVGLANAKQRTVYAPQPDANFYAKAEIKLVASAPPSGGPAPTPPSGGPAPTPPPSGGPAPTPPPSGGPAPTPPPGGPAPTPPPGGPAPTPPPGGPQTRQNPDSEDNNVIGKVLINFFSKFKSGFVTGRIDNLPVGKHSIKIHMRNETGEMSCENVKDKVYDPENKMMNQRDMKKEDMQFGIAGHVEVKNAGDPAEIFFVTKWAPKEYGKKDNGVVGLSFVISNENGDIVACGFIRKPCKDLSYFCYRQYCGSSQYRKECPEKCQVCPGNCSNIGSRCSNKSRCNWSNYYRKYCPKTCERCLGEDIYFTESAPSAS